jgi:hypothetical protein
MAREEKFVRRALSVFAALASAKRCEHRVELIKLLIGQFLEGILLQAGRTSRMAKSPE